MNNKNQNIQGIRLRFFLCSHCMKQTILTTRHQHDTDTMRQTKTIKAVIHSGIDKGWIISYYRHSVNTWTDYIYVQQNKNCIYSIFFFFFVFYIESLESPKMTSVQTISEFCGIQLRIFCFLAAKKRKKIFQKR